MSYSSPSSSKRMCIRNRVFITEHCFRQTDGARRLTAKRIKSQYQIVIKLSGDSAMSSLLMWKTPTAGAQQAPLDATWCISGYNRRVPVDQQRKTAAPSSAARNP